MLNESTIIIFILFIIFSTNFYENQKVSYDKTKMKWHLVSSWRLGESWALTGTTETACGEVRSLAPTGLTLYSPVWRWGRGLAVHVWLLVTLTHRSPEHCLRVTGPGGSQRQGYPVQLRFPRHHHDWMTHETSSLREQEARMKSEK